MRKFIIISVPHSGNHSLKSALDDAHFMHPEEDNEKVLKMKIEEDGRLPITLIRNPLSVYGSWKKRGLPLGGSLRGYWERLVYWHEKYNSVYFVIGVTREIYGQPVKLPEKRLNAHGDPSCISVVVENDDIGMSLGEYINFIERLGLPCASHLESEKA